ncbi:MFS transporter [Vibrio sp. SS-MA-C1-2]|uniref:MFS transporter n=1 Tax=Vibrio sp. SS-MA-C1-2 TaxID=2908646 RepID=UPI001F38C4C7|nr:MFS transporter [Vibrio sp. SS-MA-C1-2]UJF18405.1 MFS transporter [Vibrio sp. SS-MA-C1-2]
MVDFAKYLTVFDSLYANAYLFISIFHLIAAGLLLIFFEPISKKDAKKQELLSPSLSDSEIRSLFRLAVIIGVIAYAIMAMIMTATPLAMKASLFSIEQIKWVIQAHILAMYIPSLFTAKMVKSMGIHKMLIAGLLLMVLSLMIALISRTFSHFIFSLIFLGLGWNVLFLSGTTLLSQTYSNATRFKAQGRFDLMISLAQTSSVFASGIIFSLFGWDNLLLIALIPLFFLMIHSLKFLDQLPKLLCCNTRLIHILKKQE